jgi:hypothetical protein
MHRPSGTGVNFSPRGGRGDQGRRRNLRLKHWCSASDDPDIQQSRRRVGDDGKGREFPSDRYTPLCEASVMLSCQEGESLRLRPALTCERHDGRGPGRPRRRPARMSGVADGNDTLAIVCQRDMRSARATSTSRGSTAAKPCIVARSTGQIEPKPITPSAMRGVSPNMAIATEMTAEAGNSGLMRYRIATARKWFGFISPAEGVTMPWRSESVSLPKATWYWSLSATRRAPDSAGSRGDRVSRTRELASVAEERRRFVSLGRYALRGVSRPQELFTLDELNTLRAARSQRPSQLGARLGSPS